VEQLGVGSRSHRGQLMAGLLEKERLYVINSFFKKREHRKWTWTSPNGATKNEIDFYVDKEAYMQ
jgi:hypothetical protein